LSDKIDEVKNNTSPPLTKEQVKQKQLDFVNQLNYTRLSKTIVQDLVNSRKESVLFQNYTKEEVVKFLANPQSSEKQIRIMSNFLYANSSHYRRLCNYFSKLATFNYYIAPYNLSKDKYNKISFLVNYQKVANLLEKFNLKSQLLKIFNVCFYQDMFAGLYFETPDSFDIIQINSDYVKISSKEDGCLVYSLDFNFFNNRQYLLDSYGDDIKQMYYNYAGYQEVIDGKKGKKVKGNPDLRWQEPLNQICIKINDDQLLYSLPPFASVFPEILNLEDYKLLKKAGEQLKNYKVLSMEIPIGDDGQFKVDEEIVTKFYNQACNNIADGVGIIVSPMKITQFSFQNSVTTETDAVNQAESELWSTSGSNGLLFGMGDNPSSSSLNISIKNDTSITYALLRQIENWLNKYIKKLNLPYDFKAHFLNQSIYDENEVCDRYQKAAMYGVSGSKSLYVASLGLSPSDVIAMQELEGALNFADDWVPMQSSSTMASDPTNTGGKPTNASKGKGLTESGSQTLEDDENANK